MPPLPSNRGMMYPDEFRGQLNNIQATQGELLKNQQRQEIALAQLQASVPTRAEIQALLDQRVPQGVYLVEHAALKADLDEQKKRLDDLPTTAWNRASMIIMSFVAVGALIMSLITLLRG